MEHRRAALLGDAVVVESTRKQVKLLRQILAKVGQSPPSLPATAPSEPSAYHHSASSPSSFGIMFQPDATPPALAGAMAEAGVISNAFFPDQRQSLSNQSISQQSRLFGPPTPIQMDVGSHAQLLAVAAERQSSGLHLGASALTSNSIAPGADVSVSSSSSGTALHRRRSSSSLSGRSPKDEFAGKPLGPEEKERYFDSISRLHSMLEHMSPTAELYSDIDYWAKFATEFFSPEGFMAFKLFSAAKEQKRFDLPRSILPRHFLILYDCGITRMEICLNNIRLARHFPGNVMEGDRVTLIYHFSNGSKVISEGTLTLKFNDTLKLDLFEFISRSYTELLPRDPIALYFQKSSTLATVFKQSFVHTLQNRLNDLYGFGGAVDSMVDEKCLEAFREGISGTILGESVVNHFGVPVRTMRCFEITEMVGLMQDLIGRSLETQKGPLEVVREYRTALDEFTAHNHKTTKTTSTQQPNQPSTTATNPVKTDPDFLDYKLPPEKLDPLPHPSSQSQPLRPPQETFFYANLLTASTPIANSGPAAMLAECRKVGETGEGMGKATGNGNGTSGGKKRAAPGTAAPRNRKKRIAVVPTTNFAGGLDGNGACFSTGAENGTPPLVPLPTTTAAMAKPAAKTSRKSRAKQNKGGLPGPGPNLIGNATLLETAAAADV
ncbi:hypothetical protein HDU67_003968 [Dinochytrium kinnereticum]|nr:hypothetical protein HDU67_003968 [Dinochytrium kinnereticum]